MGFLPTGSEWKPFLLLLLLLGSVFTGWAGLALVPAFWQHQEQALGSPPGPGGHGEVPHPHPKEGRSQAEVQGVRSWIRDLGITWKLVEMQIVGPAPDLLN